jgi:hypothetical protein
VVLHTPALLRTVALAASLLLALAGAPVLADTSEPPEPEAAVAETEPQPPVASEQAEPLPPPAPRTPELTTSRSEQALEYTAIGLDALVVRPLSFAAVAVGAPFFLVAAPFAALGGHLGATYDVFLQVPIDYAWWRPLGDL